MEFNDKVNFTDSQKKRIYEQMLTPLKAQISQITLYDTKAALEFLQAYNEILENENSFGYDILGKITELEFKMQNYMGNDGKQKEFEEVSKAILQRIDDLKVNSIQLSLDEFKIRFAEIKQDHGEIAENYSFNTRETVERALYDLQANLIMKQVSEGMSANELQQTISEQDKAGLKIFVVEQINRLRQQPELKDIADRVNNILITDSDAILKTELWNWLSAAEKGLNRAEQFQIEPSTATTALAVVPKHNGLTFQEKISRLFSKEPQFPLQPRDLSKINIDWLSKYIPKSMLIELEDNKLKEENKKTNNRYVPDPKAVIYEMLDNITEMEWRGDGTYEKTHGFTKKNGSQYRINIAQTYRRWTSVKESNINEIYMTKVNMSSGDIAFEGCLCDSKGHHLNEAILYAQLLDKTFNTSFQERLFQEIQDVYIDKKRNLMPVYKNLMLSLKKMMKEYDLTKLDFQTTETARRNQFYSNKTFEQLEVPNVDRNPKDVNQKQKGKKQKNKEGKEK